jgi:carboxyl-terminal processing protease
MRQGMKKRLFYAGFVSLLTAYVFTGTQVYRSVAADPKDDPYQQLELFSRVLERVRRDYVDGDKITYSNLIQSALKGMLGSLDPHSEFMEPTKYEDLKEDTEGTFSGVGLQVSVRDGSLTVVAPMEDSPAFKAGVMAGDRITKIGGRSADNLTTSDAASQLRGEAGTKITITIERASLPEPKDIELTRAEIQLFTTKDSRNQREFALDDNKIGYVRLTQFSEHTASELEDALQKLEKQGLEGLVLDLRGNPGGLLDQAVAVSEKFVERGKPIVSTEGRSAMSDFQRRSSGSGKKRLQLPLAILVNGGSASAAEIVTGALQDLKRAVVVGEQTFGKGSVQSILPLPDGSALRLTTAKYYTPSHKVIHEKGITPDILVPLDDDEEAAIQLRRLPGGETAIEDVLKTFPAERREHLRELVQDARDPQLERAVDLLKGVNLFGKRKSEKAEEKPRPSLN